MPIGQEFLIKEPKEDAEDPREWQYNKLEYLKGIVTDFVTTRTDPEWHKKRAKELLPDLGKPGQKPSEDEVRKTVDLAINFSPLGMSKFVTGAARDANLSKYLEGSKNKEPLYSGRVYNRQDDGVYRSIVDRPEMGAHVGTPRSASHFAMDSKAEAGINRNLKELNKRTKRRYGESAHLRFDPEDLLAGRYSDKEIKHINKMFDKAYKQAKKNGKLSQWKERVVEKVATDVKNPLHLEDNYPFNIKGVASQMINNAKDLKLNKDDVAYLRHMEETLYKAIGEGNFAKYDFYEKSFTEELINLLERKGYDSIEYTNKIEGYGTNSLIILRPENVKNIVGNKGTFDKTKPSRFEGLLVIPLGKESVTDREGD